MCNGLTEEERMVVAHALREGIEKVEEAGGTQYGALTIPRARDLLSRFSGRREDLPFSELREAQKNKCDVLL